MGYVESNLMKDEVVRYRARLHWSIYVLPSILCLVIVGFFMLAAAMIRSSSSEFAVTSRRVIIKVGLLARKTIELNLSKIESIDVDQSIWGRIFGYGTIMIVGTGGTREPFRNIANPLEFRKAVNEATEAMGS